MNGTRTTGPGVIKITEPAKETRGNENGDKQLVTDQHTAPAKNLGSPLTGDPAKPRINQEPPLKQKQSRREQPEMRNNQGPPTQNSLGMRTQTPEQKRTTKNHPRPVPDGRQTRGNNDPRGKNNRHQGRGTEWTLTLHTPPGDSRQQERKQTQERESKKSKEETSQQMNISQGIADVTKDKGRRRKYPAEDIPQITTGHGNAPPPL
ncbi:hypothetical protein NDU88_005329 [Pleurodeles waltl]|uniref:Uncharacterized protein n=1 Tax=Pleurodeles waltl TaxID=8319 RepID=A0AAV7W7I5_PLEWA|nr:hypothetical protein NDU88_005329 [Pleurodeles waltl]